MAKWLDRIVVFLVLVGGTLYIAAKIHFFSRYGALSTGDYFKEHYLYTLGIPGIGRLLWVLERIKDRMAQHQVGNHQDQA